MSTRAPDVNHESATATHAFLIRYGEMLPGAYVHASGTYVTDTDGKRILDFTSGQMCATIGHNHPALLDALTNAAQSAIHLFSGMIPPAVIKLAEKMVEWLPAPLKRSMFVSTGSESNDAAIKMAKLCTGGFEILALGGSWHGVTGHAGAASFASDRRGYGPPVPGIHVLPEPNAYRCPVKHCLKQCDMTCLRVGLSLYDMQTSGAPAAIIAEPVLSAGGVIVPPPTYFQELRVQAERRGLMLIFDEAQTAFGRLGWKSGAEMFGVAPDIMTVSKTLGGGLPVAGVVTTEDIEERAHARGFTHYTSHVSDPLPAIAGLAVLETIATEQLVERARRMGAYLHEQLLELQNRHAVIGDIRGTGMLYGVELVKDRETREPFHELGRITTRRCFELGLSMNIRQRPERGAVWRIAPPLTVSKNEIDTAIAIIDRALRESVARIHG